MHYRWVASRLPKVLAQASAVLNGPMREELQRVSTLLASRGPQLRKQARARWKKLGFDSREQDALEVVALDSILDCGTRNWCGQIVRRMDRAALALARCNVTPARVVEAVGEVEALIPPLLERLAPREAKQLQFARMQAHFSMVLTLQNAFCILREREVDLLLRISSDELTSANPEQLLQTALESMVQFTGASSGCAYTLHAPSNTLRLSAGKSPDELDSREITLSAKLGRGLCKAMPAKDQESILQKSWRKKSLDCWSIPFPPTGKLAGVFQFLAPPGQTLLPRELGMLSELSGRCWLAMSKRATAEELVASGQRLEEVARRMLEVEEIERRRISRELHDDPAQDLAVIRLHLEMMEMELPADSPRRDQLLEIRTITEKTILTIRRLIFDLSPAVLEQLGLSAVLRQLVNRIQRDSCLSVRLHIGKLAELNPILQITLYRIAQGCLNDIQKHANATHIGISLTCGRKTICLTIENDGAGPGLQEASAPRQELGLEGVKERVRLLGGEFNSETSKREYSKNQGHKVKTIVKIVLPLTENVFENVQDL